MYAIKPWGKVYLVGGTVGSYALGCGMRWRESYVNVIDKHVDPSYERENHRRCVIPHHSVKMLADLGCTEKSIMRVMRPAGSWKLMTLQLHVIREGSAYFGCSTAEPVYHCEEGALMRVLRTELLRFGGTVEWDTSAFDAFESSDGSETWTLRKTYGPGIEGEAILSFARSCELNASILVDDPEKVAILFDARTGVCRQPSKDLENLFSGGADVIIAAGDSVALHMWRRDAGIIYWRCISKGRTDDGNVGNALHPLLADMMEASTEKKLVPVLLPATTPAVKEEAAHAKVGLIGNALLPVDMFEWRGDAARVQIDEASAMCRALYGKKYHRGHVPTLLRGLEQDFIVRRANYVQRDIQDAENFLAVRQELPKSSKDTSGENDMRLT